MKSIKELRMTNNGKLPPVQRDGIAGGLTGECALQWCLFLCEEADMIGDTFGYSRFKSLAETLMSHPRPASFSCRDLEEAIKAWTK